MVVEDHGNPSGFVRRSAGIDERVAFKLSLEPKKVHLKRRVPVVMGSREKAVPISRFFGLDWSAASSASRAVVVASGQIDFVDEGEVVFSLRV